MPSCIWNGNGQNISQVATITVTGVATNGTLSAIINGKSIAYTCLVSDTPSTAAAAWQALFNNQQTTPPEFTAITWTVSSNVVTATAGTPGTPFTLTTSQAGGATCTLAQTQANVSQSDVGNASNWLRSGVAQLPQNGDDMVLSNSSVPLLWNLTAIAGVLLNSYTRYQSFTGTVGLPENNPLGYVEYMPTYLKLASNINPALAAFQAILGPGEGTGPTRERYDFQSYRTNLVCIAAGSPSDAYSVRFLGSNGQNTITTTGVSVGVCMLPTEVSPTGATLNTAVVNGGGTLDCGVGCAFSGTGGGGTITITGGTSTLFTPVTVVARNSATVTLSAVNGVYNSLSATNSCSVTLTQPMTISVMSLTKSSNLDASPIVQPASVTVTTLTIDGDTCQINDPNNAIPIPTATTVNGQVSSGPFVFTGPRAVKIT
jgi:hypothetical protein